MSDGSRVPPRAEGAWRRHLPALLFWSAALLVLLPRLGFYGLEGAEDRWAEITREMRMTGDWFHPTRNAVSYFDKPLLSYWFIGLVSILTGHLDEGIVRLPSVIAGLVVLGVTIHLGRRICTERQARTAAWLLLSMFGFVLWSRRGEADMESLASILIAVTWYWARREKPGFVSYAVFWIICGIGAGTKGMVALVVPPAVILPDLLHAGRWRKHLNLAQLAALLLGIAAFLAPLAWADYTRGPNMQSGLALAWRESVGRYVEPFDHKEPFYVYLIYVPELSLPWIALLVGTLYRASKRFRGFAWPDRFLTWTVIMVFAFFTVSGSRRSYYILPILPFLALLMARVMPSDSGEAGEQPAKGRDLSWQFGLLAFFSLLELASPAFWPLIESRIGFVAPTALRWSTLVIGAASLAVLFVGRRAPRLFDALGTERRVAPLLCSSVILLGGGVTLQKPTLDQFRSTKALVLRLRDRAQAAGETDFVFYGRKADCDIVFYLETPEPIPLFNEDDAFQDYLDRSDGSVIVITRHVSADKLRAALPPGAEVTDVLTETVWPWAQNKDPNTRDEAWFVQLGAQR